MGDIRLLLIILLPLAGAALSVLPWIVSRRDAISPFLRFWLDGLALVLLCAGLVGAGVLAVFTPDGAQTTLPGVDLMMTTAMRVAFPALCGALLLALLLSWDNDGVYAYDVSPYRLAWAAAGVGALLAGAMLVGNPTTQALLIFGVALVASAAALDSPARLDAGDEMRRDFALRLSGGLKHLAIAATGTTLLLLGSLALAQHALNLEDPVLLQLGVGMVAVGLMVRTGTMPFGGAYGDIAASTPGLAILLLGATAPGAMVVGLLMLAPVESAPIASGSPGWLGALAVLIAGLRALGAGAARARQVGEEPSSGRALLATLAAMTIAVQLGWALTGVLSASHIGVSGALLLVVNIALAAPLLLASSDRRAGRLAGTARAVAVASLLGLPPLGGAVGTLLAAQSAANHSGWWLAALLSGTLLAGAGWLAWLAGNRGTEEKSQGAEQVGDVPRALEWNVVSLMLVVLIVAQVALFVASPLIASVLATWESVPWLNT